MVELRSGINSPDIGGVFFILIIDDTTYMWEDLSEYTDTIEGEVSAKWCEWPKEWHPLRPNEVCSEEYFTSTTGHDFKETIKIIVP
ncbi:hypothetical protein KAR91_01205 [Candidatus Pacearchaeota archaeon]|nr:hypothetical protein [Candidatus Pacearchaeota archaeon]